jgi:hypothetical protein
MEILEPWNKATAGSDVVCCWIGVGATESWAFYSTDEVYRWETDALNCCE